MQYADETLSFHDSAKQATQWSYILINPIFTEGGKFAPTLSYFNIAPKQKKFCLVATYFRMKFNNTHFQKLWGSRATENDVIFAFVRGT